MFSEPCTPPNESHSTSTRSPVSLEVAVRPKHAATSSASNSAMLASVSQRCLEISGSRQVFGLSGFERGDLAARAEALSPSDSISLISPGRFENASMTR